MWHYFKFHFISFRKHVFNKILFFKLYMYRCVEYTKPYNTKNVYIPLFIGDNVLLLQHYF